MLSASPPWLVLRAPDFFTATQTHTDNFTNYRYHHLAGRAGFSLLPLHIFNMVDDVTSGLLVTSPWWWWPWHRQHGQTHPGYLMTSRIPTTHPGSTTDSTVMMVDLAAGQEYVVGSVDPPRRSHAVLNYALLRGVEPHHLYKFMVYGTTGLTRR